MHRTIPLAMLVRNLIAQSTKSAPAKTFDVVHPTGAVAHAVERSTPTDLKEAVDAVAAGLPKWSNTPISERKAIFERAAALVSGPESIWTQKLHDANMKETSVTKWWSSFQLGGLPIFIKALADSAEAALKEEVITQDTTTYKIGREPYGVCMAVAAWNAVHLLTMRAIVTPLIAGNTVVFKTSETVPYTQTLFAELLFEAGLPRDALSVVNVATEDAAELIPELIADKRVRHVNFTGSTRVGSIIASIAGKNLKPVLMELGGKAPVIILPDADIETAATHIIFGTFANAGQICMSTERIIVAESRYDELVSALQAAWKAVKEKQPRALFHKPSAERVRSLIDNALESGAKSILGDKANDKDAFITPNLYAPVDTSMRLYSEESFGPVAAIIRVSEKGGEDKLIDEMVRIANDTEYGLSAAVWGKDLKRAEAVARRIESGAVHVNSTTPADNPFVPHGGWKSSGWGRFNSVEGIRSFTQGRSIELVSEPKPMPLDAFEL